MGDLSVQGQRRSCTFSFSVLCSLTSAEDSLFLALPVHTPPSSPLTHPLPCGCSSATFSPPLAVLVLDGSPSRARQID